MSFAKRNVFISRFKPDRSEVDASIDSFSDVLITKVLGENDNDNFINSSNPDYVMRRIREKYLGNSIVKIVLLSWCTHGRRYIDWKIKSSLQQGNELPNALMGIVLPSQDNSAWLPEIFTTNWNEGPKSCNARY